MRPLDGVTVVSLEQAVGRTDAEIAELRAAHTPSTIQKSGRPPLATPLTWPVPGPSACFE
jgi:hypothetical protein